MTDEHAHQEEIEEQGRRALPREDGGEVEEQGRRAAPREGGGEVEEQGRRGIARSDNDRPEGKAGHAEN